MKVSLIFIKLFVLSALLIISNGNLALHDSTNRKIFLDHYYIWLSEIFDKSIYITGYVLKSEWLPDTVSSNESQAFVLR
jgi:hypothetical protein